MDVKQRDDIRRNAWFYNGRSRPTFSCCSVQGQEQEHGSRQQAETAKTGNMRQIEY